LLLRPREGHDSRIASSLLDIIPRGGLTWRRDLYDNVLAIAVSGNEPSPELVIESRVEVELYETTPLNFIVEDHALGFPFSYRREERTALGPYLEPIYADHPRVADWLVPYRQVPWGTQTFAILDHMNRRTHAEFTYEKREEEGVRTSSETLPLGKGSCRDLAALLLEASRRLGIAARFVSGYLHGPVSEIGGAATHAWTEVYLPGTGWKGFDPTNATVVGRDHIPVAVHRHPEAIPPVAGTFTGPAGASSTLIVDLQITELPRA